jgi:diadenosine tetraphosphate (Ap4A) HIT family hydrolase
MEEPSEPRPKRKGEKRCVFCDIASNASTHVEGSRVCYQDEEIVAFHDIKPASLLHLQVIPRCVVLYRQVFWCTITIVYSFHFACSEHIKDTGHLSPKHVPLLANMIRVGTQLLQDEATRSGGKITTSDAKIGFHLPPFYSVPHLHMHVIAPWSTMSLWKRLKYCSSIYFGAASNILHGLKT